MKKTIIFLLVWVSSLQAMAQKLEDMPDEWPSPRVDNMKPKGILISYTPVVGYDLESDSKLDNMPDAKTEVSHLNKLLFKVKIPLIVQNRSKFIIGLDYSQNEYELKGDYETYAFYKSLQEKALRSRVLKLYYDHALDKKHFLYIRSSVELNGEIGKLDLSVYEFAKYTTAVFYGWQKTTDTSFGVGLYLSYDLGKPGVYPVILWNKTLNGHWGFESKFPADFNWRYDISDKQRLFAGYNVEGASYNIKLDNDQLASFEDLQLRRSDLFSSIAYEREIYDFIWCRFAMGYRFNIRFDISEDNTFKNDNIIENTVSPSPFFNVALFLTPTETLKKAFLKNYKSD